MPFQLSLDNIPRLLLFKIFRKLSTASFFHLYQANKACRNFVETSSEQRFIHCFCFAVATVGPKPMVIVQTEGLSVLVHLNINSLAKDFKNMGLHFLYIYRIVLRLIVEEYREAFANFLREVNLQCIFAEYKYPEWIELCKPKKVNILEKVNEDGYDSLRKVDFIKLYSCNLESVCDNVASHVPRLLAHITENISLKPFFRLLWHSSAGLDVNREMILYRRVSSHNSGPAYNIPYSSSGRHQSRLKLDDIFEYCPGLRGYNIEQIENIVIMHRPVIGKGTFIVMYGHVERCHTDVIGYKMADNFKEFIQFCVKFHNEFWTSSTKVLLTTNEWRQKLGLH